MKNEGQSDDDPHSPSKQKVTRGLGNPHALMHTATKAENFDSNVYSHLISYVYTKASMYVCVWSDIDSYTIFPKEIGIREINRHWVSLFFILFFLFVPLITTNKISLLIWF